MASTAGTAAATSTGQSDAQYTAKHAWAQLVAGGTTIPLSIPSGDRLTITSVQGGDTNGKCFINASLNGSSINYVAFSVEDGGGSATFQLLPVDSGTIECNSAGSTEVIVGYLTPVPAG
jgi:hypothetical protein